MQRQMERVDLNITGDEEKRFSGVGMEKNMRPADKS